MAAKKKPRERGHLSEIEPGKWRYRAPAPNAGNGSRRVHSSTFHADGARAAQAEVTRLQGEWDRLDKDNARFDGTVGKLIADWTEHTSKQSPTTVARNATILAFFNRELGHIRLADLTARHIDRAYAKLADEPVKSHAKAKGKTRSPNTIIRYHRVLSKMLKQGVRWKMVGTNEALNSSPPKRRKTSQADRVPTMAALKAMMAPQPAEPGKRARAGVSPTARIAILLAATTGARRGELMALRWSDIRNGELHIYKALVKNAVGEIVEKSTKNEEPRTVPLTAEMLDALDAHRVWQREQAATFKGRMVADPAILAHLRADPTGRTPFAPDWLSQEWERMNERAGTRFKFHGLRHMHGSLLVDAGTPLATVAKRQGHSVQVAAERYVHPVAASDLAATVTIGELTASLFT